MNGVRHNTQEVRVWGLNNVLVLGHCAISARVENTAVSWTFNKMDRMNMQLGLDLHINDETTSNPSATF